MLIIVLFCFTHRRAEVFTGGSKGGLIELAVTFDDVDGDVVLVAKGHDVFGAGIPSHFSTMALKSFNEGDGVVRGHVKAVCKWLVVEWCASLLVNLSSPPHSVIDQILDFQHMWSVGEDHGVLLVLLSLALLPEEC
jgi:hypothetical protein